MALVRKTAPAERDADAPRRAERTWSVLVEQLRHPDPEARRRAALDLHGELRAAPALLAAAREEDDPAARDAALATVASFDLVEVARELAGWLGLDDAARRNAAVVALQSMPSCVASVLEHVLAGADVRARLMAVMVITALPRPEVPRWLLRIAEGDADENVVAAAIDAGVLVDDALGHQLATEGAARFPDNPYLAFLAASVAPTASLSEVGAP
ncbi:HEAT repeat-containing protein [Quadrisphaera granulorum]|uniref:HEAT repeat protein n=1 Tax=Quadrisphaera granulorum TaxID=317664 RepID=A0A316AEJ7_9ACTN|nr:HEAT repeat domain-containing protein [Quadrisphaera granulorum]PWJ55698.1 HEAT repeat protein [Quadrisphaera granulorum]SZE95195.1 HEAT repeat-containing protein [Quadrisphaera granulorum]